MLVNVFGVGMFFISKFIVKIYKEECVLKGLVFRLVERL